MAETPQWLEIDKSKISFSLGVVPTLSSIVEVFTEPGDKVLIQTPVYSEFYDVTEGWGREVVESPLVETDGNWSVDFEDFEEKVKQAKIFFLCSPHNPLGIVWEREQLTRLCEICIKNHVLIVSDEIHSDLVFHGKKHIPTATLSPGNRSQRDQLYFRNKNLQHGGPAGVSGYLP